MDLYDDIRHTITGHRMTEKGQKILCAVSGGADSMCLMHILKRLEEPLGFRIACAHVHHGIRTAADDDAAFVRDWCQEKNIPFFLRRTDAISLSKKNTHLSLEEAARNARYTALREMAAEADAGRIATAHNADDQAETVLFSLLRGTGIKGLTGIPAVRENLIRPLLYTERTEILAYLKAQGIPYVTDETNADTAYKRNAIRHLLMPLAREQINERAHVHIAQTASELTEVLAFYETQVKEAFLRCRKEGEQDTEEEAPFALTLSVKALRAEPSVLRGAVLKYALTKAFGGKDITRRQIEALLRIVMADNGRAEMMLPGGRYASRLHDRLGLDVRGKGRGLEDRTA